MTQHSRSAQPPLDGSPNSIAPAGPANLPPRRNVPLATALRHTAHANGKPEDPYSGHPCGAYRIAHGLKPNPRHGWLNSLTQLIYQGDAAGVAIFIKMKASYNLVNEKFLERRVA